MKDDRRLLVEEAHTGATTEPPLLEHHAALLVDLERIERHAVRPVAKDADRFTQELGSVGRYLEGVDRLVERRVRVEVGAEGHAALLQEVDEPMCSTKCASPR